MRKITNTYQLRNAQQIGLVGCLTVNLGQLRGGKPAQSAKDGQQDTMHINLRYTITM